MTEPQVCKVVVKNNVWAIIKATSDAWAFMGGGLVMLQMLVHYARSIQWVLIVVLNPALQQWA